jgi:glycosyltransferase involved in cell wall biosynthesis
MRIAHVVLSRHFAGVERYLVDVTAEQRRRGHEVLVVGGAAPQLAIGLAAADVQHRPAGSMPTAARALHAARPLDVVHSHMTAPDLVAVLSQPVVRAPLVCTLHFAKPRGSTPMRRRLWSPLTGRFAAQIAISRFVAEQSGEPCTVIRNGVPDRPLVDVEQRDRTVLVAQRLEAEKDTAVAIDAWAASGLADQGWQLHLAGDGSQRPALEQRVVELDVAESVRFLGFVEDLDEHMASAGILLATAPREPFGLAVVEAMASGLPVVAAAGGAHLETVGDAGAASFAPGDVGGAAQALLRLADDEPQRRCVGEALRARQRRHFALGPHVDALLERYDMARGGHEGP